MKLRTISGVMLRPGVSANGNLYTAPMLQDAARDLSARIASGEVIPMRTFHPGEAASDHDITHTVGRLTRVWTDGDALRYEAELADTPKADEVRALVDPAKPFVTGVSIMGSWVGRKRTVDGAQTADGVHIVALDLVRKGGVNGARIDAAEYVREGAPDAEFIDSPSSSASKGGRMAEADTDTDTSTGQGQVVYADPGYQPDKKKRYPLDTPQRIRSAWAFIHMKANAAKYTDAQLKRIMAKIRAAAKAAGINIAQEAAALEADIREILEGYINTTLTSGPASVDISGYTDDPQLVTAVAQRVSLAAIAALTTLDPDQDGDIDVGKEGTGDDGPTCPACGDPVDQGDNFCANCGAALPTEGARAPEGPQEGTMTESDLKALAAVLGEAVSTAVTAAMAPVAEALKGSAPAPVAAPDNSAKEADPKDAFVKEVLDAVRAELLESYGPPSRKGLVENSGHEPAAPTSASAIIDQMAAELNSALAN